MCNELKCAIQSTVDLININITRGYIKYPLEKAHKKTHLSKHLLLFFCKCLHTKHLV